MAKQAKPDSGKPSMSALFEAIDNRDEKTVRKLIQAGGIDWSATDAQGRTLMQSALYHHRTRDIAAMLIDAGAPLEKKDLNLYWAVTTERADIVKKLIDHGADMEMKAIGGTPLHYAATNNLHEVVRVLIDAGVDINAVSQFDGTALAQAIERNGTETALLLIRAGATLDPPEHTDGTLLMTALGWGNGEVALALIEAGADVNARGKIHHLGKKLDYSTDLGAKATPLILAARVGNEKVVEALLARGADVHAKDEEGKSALDWAKAQKRAAIVKRLETAIKANPAKENLDEDLLIAAGKGDVAEARDLLKRGAKIDARDTRSNRLGFTPLMLAAQQGDVKMATLLLDAGAAVDARDSDVNPPTGDQLKQAEFMISNGAEQFIGSMGLKLGRTPLHLAIQADNAAMVTLLLGRGADANAADLLGRTPMKLANEEGRNKLVQLLKAASGSEESPKSAAPAAATDERPEAKPKSPKKKKKKTPAEAPPLPKHDFAPAAKSPTYAKALAEMESITGSKRQPMQHLDGVFTFHVHSSKAKDLNLRKVHEGFLRKGFYAFSTSAINDNQLALAPTEDKYALIAAFQTNGANYDLGPEQIIQWLRDLEQEVPFILTGIGWDFLKGHFTADRDDPHDLAQRMYEFCPDIVDQGVGDVDALADALAASDHLFFWWD
jgi:ankyrin repeat protein